jgi:hypothetical protein
MPFCAYRCRITISLWLLVYACCLIVALVPSWASESRAKKLIYFGWGIRDTQYIRDHWQEMEQMPFDGIGISIAVDRQAWQQGKTETTNQLAWLVMGTRALRAEDFRSAITDLNAAQWRTFTDNFLPVILSAAQSAHGLSWFDDDRWRIIVDNVRIVAGIAADAGLKGLILDPEHYNYELFRYSAQRNQRDHSFDAYTAMARQRGRDVMGAIAARLPNAVLLSLYGYTLPLSELKPGTTLAEAQYGLLPAFYDGLLEAMPPTAALIDGHEQAYGFKAKAQFVAAYQRIHQGAARLSAFPALYQSRVKAGFGLWLDNRGQRDFWRPAEWRDAISLALANSDGYVWIYSHAPRFFPPADLLPLYLEALREVRPSPQ